MRTRQFWFVLTLLALSVTARPAWAQVPLVQPLPDPTPLGVPTEVPPPGATIVPDGRITIEDVARADVCHKGCEQDKGYWTAGGGAYYLQLAFETNPAFTIQEGNSSRQFDFSHDMEIAPLAFVGYTWNCGLGVRGRWFRFDGDGDIVFTTSQPSGLSLPTNLANVNFNAFVPLPADVSLLASSNLSVDVYDLEATYVFVCGRWLLATSAGVRYVHLSQDYQLRAFSPAGVLGAVVTSSHNFNGAGPTFSVECRHQVAQTNVAVYGNLRNSILFGSGEQNGSISVLVGDAGSFFQQSEQTDILPISELEVGGEWGKIFGKCRVFAQAGFVGQVWWGGGNSAQGLNQTDPGTNFGFVGGVLRAGVNF